MQTGLQTGPSGEKTKCEATSAEHVRMVAAGPEPWSWGQRVMDMLQVCLKKVVLTGLRDRLDLGHKGEQ